MNRITKLTLAFGFCLMTTLSFSQKLRFKIEGVPDTTVYLTKYWGKGLYYADTAKIKNGIVEFNAKPDLQPGMLAVLLPGQKYFEFIYNKEEVSIETKNPNFIPTMVVKKSVENKLFVPYVQYLNTNRILADSLIKIKNGLKPEDEQYKALGKQVDAISKDVIAYQKKLIAANPTTLCAKIIKMSMDIELPEPPKNEAGIITDSTFVFKYYRAHFWDNIDLQDSRLVNTNIFQNKLEMYFGKTMILQQPDSILAVAIPFCKSLPKGSDMFKFCVDNITNNANKSKIMNMDKVFVMMVDEFYCKRDEKGVSLAYWMKEDKLKELCENNEIQKHLVYGVVPPNVILLDSTDKVWKDFYSLKSDYTILYFWDPECGHCKKVTPKLQELYAKKLKARNIEIFAVGKATGDDFEKWKKFIRDNGLSFINVGMTKTLFEKATTDPNSLVPVIGDKRPKPTTLESLNYHDTYDLFATPRIFLLDKDKKIIAKQLTISQLEDILDHEQKIKDPVKLFPPDPEEEAH